MWDVHILSSRVEFVSRMAHGAKRKLCSHVGCTNIDVKGGVVTRNQCSFEGCTKYVQKSEVCTTHMAQKVTRKQMLRCWMYQSSTEGRNLYYTWRETKAGAALMGCPNQVDKREEFVSRMALGRSDAVLRDVPIKPKREEFVNRMALIVSYA